MGMAERDQLILDYMRQARVLAYSAKRRWSWIYRKQDVADLVGVAYVALVEAAQHWIDRGCTGEFGKMVSIYVPTKIRHEVARLVGQTPTSCRRAVAAAGVQESRPSDYRADPRERAVAAIDAAAIVGPLSPYDRDVLGCEDRGDLAVVASRHGKTYLAVKMRRHKLRKILRETYAA